ncbi:MAG: DUF2520 domain-containing protein [Pseudomonadota bacterium]
MNALPEVVVVGCGKVGSSLAIQLKRLGWPIKGLASRRMASAVALADEIGISRTTETPWEITPNAGVVFITTPDGAIAPVCAAIAENNGFTPGTVVLHCSGAHPSTLLAAAAESGAAVGSLHPLQSFAAVSRDQNRFSGIIMAVEGMPSAVDCAADIATALGARPLLLKTEGKTLYHAAAVVASNYLVSLVEMAVEMLVASGISEDAAFSVLSPLINGTLANIAARGTTEALTGPIVRGDADTVSLHLDALQSLRPHLLPAYRSLGRQALDISRRKGHLPAETLAALERLLTGRLEDAPPT